MRMRAGVPGLVIAVSCSTPAMAQWDLTSLMSLESIWADNVDYSTTTSGDPDGDVLTTARIQGRAAYQGARWRFNGAYEPAASLYRDRTDLNSLSHIGRMLTSWGLTENSEIRVFDRFAFSPDQGARSEDISTPVLITDYSDRRGNLLDVALSTRLSEVSTLTTGLNHGFQTFSDPDLSDTVRMGAGVGWVRAMGARSGFELNARGTFNRYTRRTGHDDNDPNTISETLRANSLNYNATGGGYFGMGSYLSARAVAGGDLVVPDECRPQPPPSPSPCEGIERTRGWHVDASLQWISPRLNALLGYNQSLATGSGTFAVSRTRSAYMNVRLTMGRYLSGLLYVNHSWSTSAVVSGGDTYDSVSGGAGLDVLFNRSLTGRVQISSSTQGTNEGRSGDIDFNRITVGLVARID